MAAALERVLKEEAEQKAYLVCTAGIRYNEINYKEFGMKVWSKWGELTSKDIDAIGAIARKSEGAARIFITGEMNTDRLMGTEEDLLFTTNDMLVDGGGEPLFEFTRDATVRMTSFDPEPVWEALPAKLAEALWDNEAARYGVEKLSRSGSDFYHNLVRFLRIQHGALQVRVPKQKGFAPFYQAVYFASLFLLEKHGYMGIPAAKHFALRETEAFLGDPEPEYRALTVEETDRLGILRERYSGVGRLTNKEIDFLVGLFPRRKGGI
jgi:hypothetical protein